MQAAIDFLEWGRDVKGWSPNTIESYKSHLLSLTTFLTARLGKAPEPSDVTVDAIERHDVVIAREGKAQRSRSSIQACYISFCRYLRKRGSIGAEQLASVANMDRVRVTEKPKRRFATAEQVSLLFDACGRVQEGHGKRLAYREPLAYALLSVLAYTGARASEVCNLDRADLDLQASAPTITFAHAKGNKSRTLPLHPVAISHLQEWVNVRPSAHPKLFALPVYRMGEPVGTRVMSTVKMRGVLSELKDLAEIVDEAVLKPHAFRRFAAGALASVPGATLKHVQEFLGHSSLLVTVKYLGGMSTDLHGIVGQIQISAAPPASAVPIRSVGVRREMKHRRMAR